MDQQPLLNVRDLRIVVRGKQGDVPIVRGVDLLIRSHSIFGLVGESGCGKTLTCLSLLTLLPANVRQVGGSICLNGDNLNHLAPEEWRALRGKRIALIMQNPMSAFDPICTIGNHFVETLKSHGNLNNKAAKATAVDYMEKVGLTNATELLERYPFQLSGGMLQRVMIAIALAQEPHLIIADEPTTALDATAQVQILDLLAEVRAKFGTSILLVSHDLGVIARLADYLAVMYSGQIIEQAPVLELFDNPLHPYTRSLLNTRIDFGSKRLSLVALSKMDSSDVFKQNGCHFVNHCPASGLKCRESQPKFVSSGGSDHLVRCLKFYQTVQEVV
jgi:oligopeptide/dipeptide ABC transporter ATP-binding protein